MFGNTDLQQVLRYQADLRRDAAQRRRVAEITSAKKEQSPARRVLGLRLSLA
jgi:hypothetical protein